MKKILKKWWRVLSYALPVIVGISGFTLKDFLLPPEKFVPFSMTQTIFFYNATSSKGNLDLDGSIILKPKSIQPEKKTVSFYVCPILPTELPGTSTPTTDPTILNGENIKVSFPTNNSNYIFADAITEENCYELAFRGINSSEDIYSKNKKRKFNITLSSVIYTGNNFKTDEGQFVFKIIERD